MKTLIDIKQEYINLRNDVYGNLVGSLYPSIVYDSLTQIRKEYEENGGNPIELPTTPPPNSEGYAPKIERTHGIGPAPTTKNLKDKYVPSTI